MIFKDKYKYALPPIITAVLLCLIYTIKHIYPFGLNTIDFYDLSNQIVTYYCHVYDVLHGEKNLFYDAYTALSTNMVGTCGSSNISIFNLFFLFIRRENILPLMSIFLMIKMMVMSFCMFIFLEKTVKTDYIYKLLFSVGYAFSGFVMTTYTIIEWQDIAAFFPLIMLGLYKLMKKEGRSLYIVMLSMALIAGYYLSFIILIFIFLLVGFSEIYSKIKKEEKRTPLLELLYSTVISLGVSAFVVIPQLLQTTGSARFGNESGNGALGMYLSILKNVRPAYTSRWFILANLSLPIAFIVYVLLKTRDKQLFAYVLWVSVTLGSEFILESVNLIWHYGSYVHYPLRNGFIVSFCVYVLGALSIEKLGKTENDVIIEKRNVLYDVAYAVVCFAALLIMINLYRNNSGMSLRNVFHYFAALMAAFTVVYLIVLFIRAKNQAKISIAVVMAGLFFMEMGFYGYVFLGKPDYTTGYTEEPEMESDYYYSSVELNKKLFDSMPADPFERYKNPDESLNSNYGLVLKAPVLSNWTALISPELQNTAKNLGYSIQYTRLLDNGGTIFSDALIGVKNVISNAELDEKVYTLRNTVSLDNKFYLNGSKEYFIYNTNYSLPFGMIATNPYIDFENNDICDIYNDIYYTLGGSEAGIMDDLTYGMIVDDNDQFVYLDNFSLSGKKALYYISNQVDEDDYNTSFCVNGKEVLIPSISEDKNTLYPAHFNNNAVLLGVFEDEDVSLEISFSKVTLSGETIEKEFEPRVLALDLDILEDFINNYEDKVTERKAYKSGYDFTIDLPKDSIANEDDGAVSYLLLPISYDMGYSATNNGMKTDVVSVGGMFCAIKLYGGSNNIRIRFMPYGMKAGIIVSIASIALILCILIVEKKKKIFDLERVNNVLSSMYIVAWVAIMMIMYAIPYIYAVLSIIKVV